jgi:hypothetical protein
MPFADYVCLYANYVNSFTNCGNTSTNYTNFSIDFTTKFDVCASTHDDWENNSGDSVDTPNISL